MSGEIVFSPVNNPPSKVCGYCFESLRDGRKVVSHLDEYSRSHAFHEECLIEKIRPFLSKTSFKAALCPSCDRQINLHSLGLSVERSSTSSFFNELLSKTRNVVDRVIFSIGSLSASVVRSVKEKSKDIIGDKISKVCCVSSRVFNFIKERRNIGFALLLGVSAAVCSTNTNQALLTSGLTIASFLVSKLSAECFSAKMERVLGPRISIVAECLIMTALASQFFLNHLKPFITDLALSKIHHDPTKFIELGALFGVVLGLSNEPKKDRKSVSRI